MLSPTVLGVIICAAAAVLEACTRRQRCSSAAGAASHAGLFSTIRTLARHRFSVLCDVLRNFAPCAQHWACVALTGFCACPDGCAPTRERVLERVVLPVVRPAGELHRIRALYDLRRRTGHPSRQDLSSRGYPTFALLHLSYLCYSMGLSSMAT